MSKLTQVSIFRPTIIRSGKKVASKFWWVAWRDPVRKVRRTRTSGTDDRYEALQFAEKLRAELQSVKADAGD